MFKRSILLPVAAMIGLLLTVFLLAYHWEHEKTDHRDMANLLGSVQTLFELNVHNEVATMEGLITAVSRDESLAAAFTRRDRAAMGVEVKSLFEQFQRNHHISRLRFLTSDGDVFYRAHLPQRYGDRDLQRLHRQSRTEGRAVAGFEVGADGRLGLNVIAPWRAGGSVIGYLEIGEDAAWLVDQVAAATDAQLFWLLPQDRMRPEWMQNEWPAVGEWLLVAGRFEEMPPAVARWLEVGDPVKEHERKLPEESAILHAGLTAMIDPRGDPLGQLLVLQDVTAQHQDSTETLSIVAVVGLLVGASMIFFFDRIVGRVDEQVATTEEGLKHMVEQRTVELDHQIEGRKLAEEQLALLFKAVEQSPVSVMITDIHGEIQYVNPTFTALTGYMQEEVRGANPRFLKSGDKSPEEYRALWETILGGGEWRGEFTNVRKDGSLYSESAVISPVWGADGNIHYFIAVKEDITERKLTERRLSELQEEIAHVDRLSLLGEMAATLAHEVKQPLATIVNYAGGCIQRIKSGQVDPEALLFAAEKIAEQGKLAGEVIRGVREFVTKTKPQTESVKVNHLVREAVELIRGEAAREGVAIETKLAEGLPPAAADPLQIRQVLMNLMLNAVQAMESVEARRRRLHIATERGGADEVRVTVRDEGPGVDTTQLDQLFKHFYTTKPTGMGMGLAICRTIVEAHGGRITVTPNADHGLSFTFTLPVAEDEELDAA